MAADLKLSDELSSVSFEDLVKLKDKLGSKIYLETIFGTSTKRNKPVVKRLNKNRPREVSSKVRVSSHREVFTSKGQVKRDPRFDPNAGEYDEVVFNQTYGFLNKIKDKEKHELKRMLTYEEDEEKREEIKNLLNKIKDRELTAKMKKQKSLQMESEKVRVKQELKQGKKPFFLKKSEKKKLELAERFKELKSSGKLEKYMQKKRKKAAQIDRKSLPLDARATKKN